MKTLINLNLVRKSITLFSILVCAGCYALIAQDFKSVLGEEVKTGSVWGLNFNTSSVQNHLGTQFEIYGGTVINHSFMAGIIGSMNLTHPKINFGYCGLVLQYTYRPERVFHVSGQLTMGTGSVRDYESEKSNIWDNFGNISGNTFYIIRPVINGEINISTKTRMVLGVGYNYITGIDNNNSNVSNSHVSDQDLSGFSFTAGVKFGMY